MRDDSYGSSGHPNYTLTSDIAQFCFPAASQDSNRKYAYACSIYLTFLLIGIIGALKAPQIIVREVPPPQERIVEVDQVNEQQPVVTQQPETMDQQQDQPTDAPVPVPVLVAPATAAVPFAVPTEGYTKVTKVVERAAAPPMVAPRPPPAAPAPKPAPAMFRRGSGTRPNGNFPEPAFPTGMLRSGQSVDLTLKVELGDDGVPVSVDVETPSGIYELDRKVAEHVKSRWKWDPGQAKTWLVPFGFKCR